MAGLIADSLQQKYLVNLDHKAPASAQKAPSAEVKEKR